MRLRTIKKKNEEVGCGAGVGVKMTSQEKERTSYANDP
jgi:hypothetical protein